MPDQSGRAERPSPPPPLPPPAERLAYEHTMRVIDRQVVVLSELRTRASIVLTATGIIASLLGKAALDQAGGSALKGWLTAFGLFALGVGLLGCIGVLLAVHDEGTIDPARMKARGIGSQLLSLVRPEKVKTSEKDEEVLREWQVTLKQDTIEKLFLTATSEADARRKIVSVMSQARSVNYCTIDLRSHLVSTAAVALVLQIAFWAAAIVL